MIKKNNNKKQDNNQAKLKKFPHLMIKEIFEQPEAVKKTMEDRIDFTKQKVNLPELEAKERVLKKIKKIIIVGCGTARCAGLVGQHALEEIAEIPVEVDYASEFKNRKKPLNKETLVIAVSQSGETADTLASVRKAKKNGLFTLAAVNTVGSAIAVEADAVIYLKCGPEKAIASTKAFTSQLVVLAIIAAFFAELKKQTNGKTNGLIKELNRIPSLIKEALGSKTEMEKIARKYYKYKNFVFLGRSANYPIAFEGALKLKEISYIQAEGLPGGEIKHGPIAMIDKNFPSVIIAPIDSVYESNLSLIKELKEKGGKIIAIATKGDKKIKKLADDVVYIPKTETLLTPLLSVIPLQLFAYYMAVFNKRNVDRPRNLTKSVTV